MKKILITVCINLIMCSCSYMSNKNINYEIQYTKCSKKSVSDNKYISFTITKHSTYNETIDPVETFYLIYSYDKKNPSFSFINSDSTRFLKFDNKNYYLVDHNNKELAHIRCIGKEGKDAYWIMKNTTESVFREIPYYHQLLGFRFIINNTLTHEKFTDTIIRDINCKVFESLTPMGNIYNSETQIYDIPIQYSVLTYINTINYHVDSVCVENSTENTFKLRKTYIISDISFEDKGSFLDSVFNFSNENYSAYSYHNENKLPYSMRGSANKEINETILNFPLVSLENDTIYLKDNKSWVLLNLWSLNCPPCIENLNNYKNEKDSLGYRILENEGIEIIAINYSTDNMELLNNIANKTNSNDIIYSAKGLNAYISIPYLGYYYLFSPDKKVVFKDYELGDYSKLLKAKEEYEKLRN